jgi:hypothetical protein
MNPAAALIAPSDGSPPCACTKKGAPNPLGSASRMADLRARLGRGGPAGSGSRAAYPPCPTAVCDALDTLPPGQRELSVALPAPALTAPAAARYDRGARPAGEASTLQKPPPDPWAAAVPQVSGQVATTIQGIATGLFGAEARRLAAEGQYQQALFAAQAAQQTNELEKLRLANAARELELRARELELRAQQQQKDAQAEAAAASAGAVPDWVWYAAAGAGVLAVGGLVTWAVVRSRGAPASGGAAPAAKRRPRRAR